MNESQSRVPYLINVVIGGISQIFSVGPQHGWSIELKHVGKSGIRTV